MDKRCDISRCGVKIDLGIIRKNLEGMISLAKGKLIMSVIKADAYGHGAVRVAQAIEDITDMFAVATVDEGIKLRTESGTRKPILILGPASPSADEMILNNDLTQTVFNLDRAMELDRLVKFKGVNGLKAKVHIAVDTGMSRIGVMPDESGLEIVKKISGLSNISVDGIFTHFATADALDKTITNKAYKSFIDFKKMCVGSGINIPVWHSANSASVIDGIGLDDEMDMARCGISIYGMYPSDEVHKERLELDYPMEWYSFLTRISKIKAGTFISYGCTFEAKKDMVIATVSCGYADGYPRLLSNKGRVLLHGKPCPVVGRVCMDQFMIDVTDVPFIKVGDRVILMGSDGDESITPDEIAEKCGTIGYEIVCGISSRVPRIYTD